MRFKFECKVMEPGEGLTFYMALKSMVTQSLITNIKQNITAKDLTPGQTISFGLTIQPKQVRQGQYDLYFAIGNTDASLYYDVIDGNINLPALIVLPLSDDPDDNMGFFNILFSINESNT